MSLHAGFAEVDITPPLGTRKIGWLRLLTIERILDPLFARAAAFESNGRRIGFIQLDTLCVRWVTVDLIRRRIEQELGFPGSNIMIGATHNHGGPAVKKTGEVKRDDDYLATLVDKCVSAFSHAIRNMADAELGYAGVFDFELASCRRILMRDGTARTHGHFGIPGALCFESPIDPQVAVMAVRHRSDGSPMGCLVNFTCHPTDKGGTDDCTAGWPGVMARIMKGRGWPVPLFLNGAAGDIAVNDATREGYARPMEDTGTRLADNVCRAIDTATFSSNVTLASASTTVMLPNREPTVEQVGGTAFGAQRFIDPKLYEKGMPELLERIRSRGDQPAEVQVLLLNDLALVAIPAEYFCRLGLRIKRASRPRHGLVVGFANGMVGYVPHTEAFDAGGYETTFGGVSRLAPQAGDLLADAAIRLIHETA